MNGIRHPILKGHQSLMYQRTLNIQQVYIFKIILIQFISLYRNMEFLNSYLTLVKDLVSFLRSIPCSGSRKCQCGCTSTAHMTVDVEQEGVQLLTLRYPIGRQDLLMDYEFPSEYLGSVLFYFELMQQLGMEQKIQIPMGYSNVIESLGFWYDFMVYTIL